MKSRYKFGFSIDHIFKLCKTAPKAILYVSAARPSKMISVGPLVGFSRLEAYLRRILDAYNKTI